ncbi:unnamed protein product [Lactuca saligna]|uniref:Uncharacterized protein n=1 Tax=Lactuca saligna TaxID=75948 RepID=A0AA36E2L1_LACSI|nr:unnamed protein product [Lactuca saligna]
MFRSVMPTVHSTVNHEWLDQVTIKYHLVEEDDAIFPATNTVIDRSPPSKDLGSMAFHLPILDDSFIYSGSNGNSSHDRVQESSESSIGVHEYYNNMNDSNTTPIVTRPMVNVDGDVPLDEMYKVRDERVFVKNEKVVLESKLVGYDDVVKEVSTLMAIVASLELDKIRLLDNISMLDHDVRKLKRDLNEFTPQNSDLQASMVGLENQLSKVNGDVTWVLSHEIMKLVDKILTESSFFKANRDLQSICVDFGRRAGYEMMNTDFKMSLHETNLPLYDPSHVKKN